MMFLTFIHSKNKTLLYKNVYPYSENDSNKTNSDAFVKKKQTKNKKEAQNSDNSQELTSDNCPTKIGSWPNDRFLISRVVTKFHFMTPANHQTELLSLQLCLL